MKEKKFIILDGLRGFTALYVVFHHARLLCWESYYTGYLKHPYVYNKLDVCFMYFFSFFKYGGEAVTVFFVLSGFVIHYKQSNSIKLNSYNFNFKKYFKNRVRRIYPPLLFSILLMLTISLVNYFLQKEEIPHELSFRNILGNLTFIGVPFFSIVGSNFPLWSLRVEWWLYMLYPILLWANKKSVKVSNVLIMLAAAIIYFAFSDKRYFWIETMLYLPTWCVGVLIADIITGRVKYYFITNILSALLIFVLIYQNYLNNYSSDFLFGIGLIPFFVIILGEKQYLIKKVLVYLIKPFTFLSGFSYTMYIIHFPIQSALAKIYMRTHNNLLPHSFYLAFLSIIISVTISYFSHFFTEKKFA